MIKNRQQTLGTFFKKRRKLKVFLIILLVIIIALAIDFFIVRHIALKRFKKYEAMAESADTSYGKISYIDKGSGEPFLIFHGITGGYDQGFDVMDERTDTYRVIAPSRFGYPGSDLPENAKFWSGEIPNCKSVFFTGGGHLMDGNSDEINSVVDEFVEENK